jgi:uncharacterized membrane-anchored protein
VPSYVSKLPEAGPAFWAGKVFAAPVAALAADGLADALGLTLSTALLLFVLAAAVVVQLAGRRYSPARYWMTLLLACTAGRLLAEDLTDDLRVPVAAAAGALAGLLAATLATWRVRQGTLSISTVDTPAREAWYWLAALWALTLGSLELPHPAVAAAVVAVLLALVAAAHRLDPPVTFWLAFPLTQTLGLLLGVLLAEPRDDGGAGLGTAVTGAVALALLAGAVVLGRPPRPEPVPVGTRGGDR